MDFSTRHSHPQRHLVGFGLVVLFHAFVIYSLATGMAKRVIDVVRAPVETKLIEEIKKPPPIAEVIPPPPELKAPPPPPYIPPPEVQVATPPPVQNTITAITTTPPPAPVVIAPVAPPPLPAEPTAAIAKPAPPVSASVVCANYATVMGDAAFPREAQKAGINKGEALVQFTLGASGQIRDVRVLQASHPIFARNSVRIVSEYNCQGQGHDVVVQVPFGYKVE